jgi:hypothetical protein
MSSFNDLIGRETDLPQVGRTIRLFAEAFDLPIVGAFHVTCSDETESECADVFERLFAQPLLPSLKTERRAPFRAANLGARYEPGAVHVAEEHFAAPEVQHSTKLIVVKINSHVAFRPTPEGPQYGTLRRYGNESDCCGALAALVQGSPLPAVHELEATFGTDRVDRLAMLRDPQRVPPELRALLAAVTNARLQAARAVLDITEHEPASPTIFLVLPCVTINRQEPDTEVLIGEYGIDATGAAPRIKYRGLGDSPAAYQVRHEHGRVVIEDDHWPEGSV